ncbi:MAG: hypothetical protein K9I94_09910 [Bacteroidales bacterium]|nr:hypothetical protein [Bacteroidales bacterium]
MNKKLFEKYLNDPYSLSQASLDQLEKVITDFPYCQVAHLLYVRNLYQQGSIQFNQKLKVAAAYAGSRRQLKSLIENTPVMPEPQQETVQKASAFASEHSDTGEIERPAPAETGTDETTPQPKAEVSQEDFTAYLQRKKEENSEKTKKELIEDFIKEEPTISSPPKHKFFKASEAAEKSLEEHNDLFSETLARIYLKQGNAEKAKRIYKQLMLKFPEKSSYFAAQLKKLDESE